MRIQVIPIFAQANQLITITNTHTMKIYKNNSYTRTVEVIKTTKKCLSLGWSQNVKVTTVYNDTYNTNNGNTRTTEQRFLCGDDYLDYDNLGQLYYTKRK